MQVSDRESAVFALPRATVWDLLLRVDFAQLAAGSSYLSLRPVPVSLRCSSACSNSRSHPASPSFRVVGASSQQGLLQVECTTQLREDGPALTRQEQFRLFPITRTGGTLLEWTTTATVTIAAAAAVSKSVEGLGALLQRSLSKRQLFHLIRDEANPKPAREKLEDLLGVLVGQIKSTPSYLENLASSVDVEKLPGWEETVARGDGVLTVDMDSLPDFEFMSSDDSAPSITQTNSSIDLSQIDLSGAEARLLAHLNISLN